MAKDKFTNAVRDVDYDQRVNSAQVLGLEIPDDTDAKRAQKVSPDKAFLGHTGKIFKNKATSNFVSSLFNASTVLGAGLLGAVSLDLIDSDTITNIEFPSACFHYVTADNVNVRNGPGLNYNANLQLSLGSPIKVTGYKDDGNGRTDNNGIVHSWAQVDLLDVLTGLRQPHFIRSDNVDSTILPRPCYELKR